MLTVAYCRVSTEEQAAEGFSIEGQADKLRSYAELHDLGQVTVIEDPGRSGKDVDRPGLQQLLAMVEAGHVTNILIWRLDRLSRNLGDLIILADSFGKADVALHSFTEKLDLSSATGRMFYNILGSFAQFYREQLAENVRMGMHQAAREGKWTNRPKTGYDLVAGELIANSDAARVQEIFRLRGEGRSYREIEDRTGIKYSTVMAILRSRIYLGEVYNSGEWFPGHHKALVTPEEFGAAHRGHVPGVRRGKDLLSGRVLCGLCSKRMAIEQNGQGREMYRCRSRGTGCDQPRRTNTGLHKAALLGLCLIGGDQELQEAIRRQLARTGQVAPLDHLPARRRPASALMELSERRRKLLELHYQDRISAELFGEQELQLTRDIEAVRSQAAGEREQSRELDELSARFEEVAAILREPDFEQMWIDATKEEQRVLIEELVEQIIVFPDHLEVCIHGAPKLNVRLAEVGLSESQNVGVGGGSRSFCYQALAA